MNGRLILFYFLLVTIGILPISFRRVVWLRCLCVALLLGSTLVACFGVSFAAHTARDRLAKDNSPMSRSFLEMGSPFRQGSDAAGRAAEESLPIFMLVIGALAVMAFVSVKQPRTKNEPANPSNKSVQPTAGRPG
jgi:hypothetical protein